MITYFSSFFLLREVWFFFSHPFFMEAEFYCRIEMFMMEFTREDIL